MVTLRLLCLSALCGAIFALACDAQDQAGADPAATGPKRVVGGPPPNSPPQLPDGITVEQMWRPPTEAEWSKPVLIEFQRNWNDAVAVSQRSGKPILVCINMDGEIASEHYAGVHYRTPETAQLFEDYVCVIASVYRHTPRDHDENGERIPCPRFGSVTCGEHIAIEPFLFETFMDGQRISPRHIMVELDGSEVYDVFYAWDNASIFTTIKDAIEQREQPPREELRGDRSIFEKVASRDRADREAVEQAWQSGDRELRRRLLEMAKQHPEASPVELLRLAVFDVDQELAKLAREALVQIDDVAAVGLLGEAIQVPLPAAEREALVQALERQRDRSPQARLLATVHRGLGKRSKVVGVSDWSQAGSGGATYSPPASFAEIEQRVDAREAATRDEPEDAQALLALAEASLEMVLDPNTAGRFQGDPKQARQYGQLMFEDARRQALRAAELGEADWRIDAIVGLVEYYIGDADEAYRRVIAAAEDMPAEPANFTAVATLSLFAEARIDAIWKALRAKQDWPGEWMSDVDSAYAVLARHPYGTAQHALTHYDFLDSLGAKRRAGEVLDRGLERFPGSPQLHDRLRARLLERRGVEALEQVYAERLEMPDQDIAWRWYAGYAALVTAEFHRRAGEPEPADAAYQRAISQFERVLEQAPDWRDSTDHYVALALAGRARLAIERDDLAAGLDLLLAGIARRPASTPSVDGLNISPAMTARLLSQRLEAAGDGPGRARLQQVLDGLQPEWLAEPVYETEAGGGGEGRGGARRRRR